MLNEVWSYCNVMKMKQAWKQTKTEEKEVVVKMKLHKDFLIYKL